MPWVDEFVWAVVWTDVFQIIMMFAGLFAIIIQGKYKPYCISHIAYSSSFSEFLNQYRFNTSRRVRESSGNCRGPWPLWIFQVSDRSLCKECWNSTVESKLEWLDLGQFQNRSIHEAHDAKLIIWPRDFLAQCLWVSPNNRPAILQYVLLETSIHVSTEYPNRKSESNAGWIIGFLFSLQRPHSDLTACSIHNVSCHSIGTGEWLYFWIDPKNLRQCELLFNNSISNSR
jgi:hypothetical protein